MYRIRNAKIKRKDDAQIIVKGSYKKEYNKYRNFVFRVQPIVRNRIRKLEFTQIKNLTEF